MADNKKKRKSDRHFNLAKPVERSFEIEKDVDMIDVAPTKPELNKPQPAVPIAPEKGQETVKEPSDAPKVKEVMKPEKIKQTFESPKVEDSKKPEETISFDKPEDQTSDEKSSKWKWLIPAAIVVAAVPSYFLFSGNDDTPSEDQIVATAPEAGQTNAGDTATDSSASTGEGENSNNATNADANGAVDKMVSPSEASSSKGTGSVVNPSKTGNVSSPESENVSSGSRNVGNASSEAKASTSRYSDVQSVNKSTPVSSTKSSGGTSENVLKTKTPLRQSASESGNSKNTGTQGNSVVSGSVEQKALDVIRGIYGNGQVRKDKLGAEYAEIQKLVNEMYRNGRVK